MAEALAKAMDDDFNSREAVAKVLGGVREIGKSLDSDLEEKDKSSFANFAVEWMEEYAGLVLGILPSRDEIMAEKVDPRREEIRLEVEDLLKQRTDARANKDWPAADAIRDKLVALGVTVVDTADGPVWEL